MSHRCTFVAAVLALSVGVALGAGPVQAAVGPGDWAQQGAGPAHTSAIRSPGGLSPATVSDIGLRFSAPTRADGAVAVAGGVAYAGNENGRLVAMSTQNGRTLWSQSTCDGDPVPSHALFADQPPAIGANTAWVVSVANLTQASTLTAISLTTHAVTHCVPLGADLTFGSTAPTLAGGSVFAAAGNKVTAVNATTGAVQWTAHLPNGVVSSTLAVDGGLVIVPAASSAFDEGWVYAYRSIDGHPVWTYQMAAPVTTVTVSGGRVFAGAIPTALDEPTGHQLWRLPGYFVADTGWSVSGSRLFFYGGETCNAPASVGGSCEGTVFAFDTATGHRLWMTSLTSEGAGVVSVGGGLVYLTDSIDEGIVHVLSSATGAVVTSLTHPGGFYTSQPVVVAGSVYLVGYLDNSFAGFLDAWAL
ncbi:MAG: PQQ-binding-like beta-propeller repeat protein [Actinomycetota bacterium]|nr:PQQ-binding-like beta-propeller repeat protein [Actinomycetota bacterium]